MYAVILLIWLPMIIQDIKDIIIFMKTQKKDSPEGTDESVK